MYRGQLRAYNMSKIQAAVPLICYRKNLHAPEELEAFHKINFIILFMAAIIC